MNFDAWLAAQVDRADPVGDLARDASVDPELPTTGNFEDYELHLNLGPGRWLLEEAWAEFENAGSS